MKSPIKALILTIVCVAAAIASMHYLNWLNVEQLYSQSEYMKVWSSKILVGFALLSLIFGAYEPRAPWRWPLLLMYVSYFSGFFIMKHWGQIPPFEIVVVGVQSIPLILLAYVGRFVRRRVIDELPNRPQDRGNA